MNKHKVACMPSENWSWHPSNTGQNVLSVGPLFSVRLSLLSLPLLCYFCRFSTDELDVNFGGKRHKFDIMVFFWSNWKGSRTLSEEILCLRLRIETMLTWQQHLLHKNKRKRKKEKYGELRDPESKYSHCGCNVVSNKLFRGKLKVCFHVAFIF